MRDLHMCAVVGLVGLWVGFAPTGTEAAMTLQLTSPVFQEGGTIPSEFTCDGANASPPLAWSGTPQSARALALIVTDPDAPSGTWTHWVLFNLPPTQSRLPQGYTPQTAKADGARNGVNDFHALGYGGPCPPKGSHRYAFTLYALDQPVPVSEGATRAQVEAGMKGHILAEAPLTGTYQRIKRPG